MTVRATRLRIAKCFLYALLPCIGAPASLRGQGTNRRPQTEPRAFYEDDGAYENGRNPFSNPVPLPGNVLDALRATPEAKSDDVHRMDRDDFAGLFKAVKIHLNGPNEVDYVVMGEFPMGGADAPWFWIVRSDRNRPKIIFYTFANGFELLKTSSDGYPDIRSEGYTAAAIYTNVYHYDGQQYRLVHRYTKNRDAPQ